MWLFHASGEVLYKTTLLQVKKKEKKLMGWSFIFVSALYHMLPSQNVSRFRLDQINVCFFYYFLNFQQLHSALVFPAQCIPLRPGQNLDDALINITLADVFYF